MYGYGQNVAKARRERVVTMERAGEVRVVTGLTVFHPAPSRPQDDVIDLMAVHPAIAFVFLLTLMGITARTLRSLPPHYPSGCG